MIAVGELAYDPERGRLYKYGRPLSLGRAPLRLLAFLMEHPERSFTIDELIAHLWGEQVLVDERARCVVRSQVRRIRLAIEDDTGPWLANEGPNQGYGLWAYPPVTRASQLTTR